jgi:hypothetical protein
VTFALVVIGSVSVGVIPQARAAKTPVTIEPPTLVRAAGALVSWSRVSLASGQTFQSYTVHRLTPGPSRCGRGQAGENAVRAQHDIGDRAPYTGASGKDRISDGTTPTVLSEVKNVKRQGYTQQIKDAVQYAKDSDRRFDLYVRSDTHLTEPLTDAIRAGDYTSTRFQGCEE